MLSVLLELTHAHKRQTNFLFYATNKELSDFSYPSSHSFEVDAFFALRLLMRVTGFADEIRRREWRYFDDNR